MTPSKPSAHTHADDLIAKIDQLEHELDTMRAQLDSAARLDSLGLLTGAIAHEFNNILTPVLSYARIALDNPDDAALTQKALERAATGVEKATRIAGSVLRLAGSQPSPEQNTASCMIDDALAAALASLPQPLEAENIDLKTDFDPCITLCIRQTDLEHVLLNLILNAIRAMQLGKLRQRSGGDEPRGVLTISCHMHSQSCSTWNTPTSPPSLTSPNSTFISTPNTQHDSKNASSGLVAHILVTDTGVGIGYETQKIIPIEFNSTQNMQKTNILSTPFLEKNHEPQPQPQQQDIGNGLGLMITRRLVEAAKGRIAAHSKPGQGAAFDLLIPARYHATKAG